MPLGPADEEGEGAHLRRVAEELAAAGLPLVRRLLERLRSGELPARRDAAEQLGLLGSRDAVAALRELLEDEDPAGWEVAVHGLRQDKERAGWLCLESVALGCVPKLASKDPAEHRLAAFRLLMMGRTKTMDRLFRAADGHSRAIPQEAARRFVRLAVSSLPPEHALVMSLRLGAADGRSRTPPEAAAATGLPEERVRELEAEAWAMVQSPRPYEALRGLDGRGGQHVADVIPVLNQVQEARDLGWSGRDRERREP